MDIVIQPTKTIKSRNAYVLLLSISALLAAQSSLALEKISEKEMSESVGEGVALLPENFFIRMNDSARDSTGAYDPSNNQQVLDAGYVRIVPVGQVSQERKNAGFDKADIYYYGLAISQSNKDLGQGRDDADFASGFGRPIKSWGTEKNPWVIQTKTEENVPTFGPGKRKNVSYYSVNAPEFDKTVFDPSSNASADEKSAYNLKLGLWADIYKRDSSKAENGYDGLSDRTRLNMRWDGFSINGTQLRAFQTLDGAENAKVPVVLPGGLPKEYNNTLGISGLVRINSGDGTKVRANTTNTITSSKSFTTTHERDVAAYKPSDRPEREYHERVQTTTLNGSSSWVLPGVTSVLKIGTAENAPATGAQTTPALGGKVPTFNPTEGLFAYNANVNLPIGQTYQPFMVNTNNGSLVFELARIANNPEIYQQFYQKYEPNSYEKTTDAQGNPILGSVNTIVKPSDNEPAVYYGNTCNFNQCGKEIDGKFRPATHGSITIGSTNYNADKNHTSAYSGPGSYGVSFGKLANKNLEFNNDSHTSGIQYQRRRLTNCVGAICSWQYLGIDGWITRENGDAETTIFGSWNTNEAKKAVWYDIGSNTPVVTPPSFYAADKTKAYFNPSYELQNVDYNPSPMNNLGSAVIDGFSVQYMKLTINDKN